MAEAQPSIFEAMSVLWILIEAIETTTSMTNPNTSTHQHYYPHNRNMALRLLGAQLQRSLTLRASNTLQRNAVDSFKRPAIGSTLRQYERFFSDGKDDDDTKQPQQSEGSVMESSTDYNIDEIVSSFRDTSYFDPEERPDYSQMTNEELEDSSTIPGWELIHSPPKDRTVPRGALVGTVVSTKMQKTVNVAVDRYKVHPKYRKRLRYTRKFMAHDEKEVANNGDLVMIVPCHKISKHKHFMLREIIRAKGQL